MKELKLLKTSLFKDLKLNKNKIKVIPFNTLTIKLCKKYNANVIIRGLKSGFRF